ncbi:hypothetical protein QJQ45_002833 [Haematococcus lacustris]|nr:hypothetical protein QJQ45_002833 [Haematococcus lacustris]
MYAKAARAQLGWSGEEARLFIKIACGYGINPQSSELQAATLDNKGHVVDLIEEADKHRRLLGIKKQGSLQDTLPLHWRMRHAVHVCRCLEQWQQPFTPPVPGQPKRGKRRGVGPGTLTCPPPFTLTLMARVGVHFVKVDRLHGVCKQLGPTKETKATFTLEPALSYHWARGIAETREYVFDPDTQIGGFIDRVQGFIDRVQGFIDRAQGFIDRAQGFGVAQFLGVSDRVHGFADRVQGFIDLVQGFIDVVQGFIDRAQGFKDLVHGFIDRAQGLKA